MPFIIPMYPPRHAQDPEDVADEARRRDLLAQQWERVFGKKFTDRADGLETSARYPHFADYLEAVHRREAD